MRAAWPICFGIALLGCKEPSTKPAEQGSAGRSPSGAGAAPTAPQLPAPSAAVSAPPAPRLDPTAAGSAFDAEVEDQDWAVNTERAIKAAAPELTDIDCKHHQCRASLSAASESELVAKAERLSDDEGLRGTTAKRVLLTAPTSVDGKLSMKIYVQYER